MTSSLQTQLTSLSSTNKLTVSLIHRLQRFTATPGQGDEARLELSAEIHLRLKEMDEEMELIRVEIERLEAGGGRRRESEAKEAERERMVSMTRKLEGDVKHSRTHFRKAQLQAKRNAEIAKRKERELLFSGVGDGERKKSTPKLTQDDLVVNASNDVTSALRRTHQLMQAELSRSQFAQQTLEQSTAALSSLSESYGNLDSLLSSSRTLVTSLIRSQKSDTWYLETAFYILVGTIIWLLFRRIFYGPLWWLLWIPLKLAYRTAFAVLGIFGMASGGKDVGVAPSISNSVATSVPTIIPSGSSSVEAGLSSTETQGQETASTTPESVTSQIEKIIDESEQEGQKHGKHEGTNVDDISPEERQRQEEMPQNPKKRMWEEKIDNEARKDEL